MGKKPSLSPVSRGSSKVPMEDYVMGKVGTRSSSEAASCQSAALPILGERVGMTIVLFKKLVPGTNPVPHTVLHTQIPLGESRSPRSADKPVSTVRPPLPLRRTCSEPSGHRNLGTAWDRILPVSVCTQSRSCTTVLHTQIPSEESWSPRSANMPVSTDKTNTSAQIPCTRWTFPEPSGHRNQGTSRDRILLVSVCTPELTLCHSTPYPNSSQRDLVSQEY